MTQRTPFRMLILAVLVLALSQAPVWSQADGLVVKTAGVGIFKEDPTVSLDVVSTDAVGRTVLRLTGTTFYPQLDYYNQQANATWRAGVNTNGHFVINETADLSIAELRITPDGQLYVNGSTTAQIVPDYVFDPDYMLLSLDELDAFIKRERHLPDVTSAAQTEEQGGVNLTTLPLQLLRKIEELTLYTIQQHDTIRSLKDRLASLEQEAQARLSRQSAGEPAELTTERRRPRPRRADGRARREP